MKTTWCQWIVKAFQDLGGDANLDELYQRLTTIRSDHFSREWKATVRRTIETYSSDSDNYRENNPDLFCLLGAKGSGHWGLRRK